MTPLTRQRDAATQVRHVAVDTQHFVAVTQALTLGVDQQHNGSPGEILHGVQHTARLGQGKLHPDGCVVRGANHRDRLPLHSTAAAEQIARAHHGVRIAKKRR